MKKPWRTLALFVCVLVATCCTGARAEIAVLDFKLWVDQEELFVSMSATNLLDDKTRMTVESGLPGTCVYILQVVNSRREVLSQRIVERTLRFNLWENVVELEEDGQRNVFTSIAAADSAWAQLDSLRLGSVSSLSPSDRLGVVVAIAVEPIAPKDRERLSRYVGRNSSGKREELLLDLGAVLSRLVGASKKEEAWRYASDLIAIEELEVSP